MPAGYVTEDGMSYMVRVGDKFEDIEDMENLVITDLSKQGLGVIYLKDVADIAVTDNSDEVYAKMNGNAAVLVSVEKQNGYSTADVAKRVRAYIGFGYTERIRCVDDSADRPGYLYRPGYQLGADKPRYRCFAGDYCAAYFPEGYKTDICYCNFNSNQCYLCDDINVFYRHIHEYNFIVGACARCRYAFVDNSIVVIENIYRLRSEGKPVKEAAINGAKQVTGAIAASTLTTVCIWAPIIFTEGLTR